MDNSQDIIIGREREQALIQEYYDSPKAELVAIYGRQRVGKTYLIKSFFNQKFDFYFTGAFETPKATLLRLFQTQLERYSGKKRKKPQDWFEAFEQLRDYLSSLDRRKLSCSSMSFHGWTRRNPTLYRHSVIFGTVGPVLYTA